MKAKLFIAMLCGLSLLFLPALALSAKSEVSGTINGYSCTVKNAKCPADKMDPHLATEHDFVLMMEDGKHLLITNVSDSVLSRHVLEKVKISGDVNEKYGSIKASKISVMKGERYVQVWSKEEELKAIQDSTMGE